MFRIKIKTNNYFLAKPKSKAFPFSWADLDLNQNTFALIY